MASIIKVDTIQSTTSNVFFQNSSGTEYARFDSSGNLGIGAASPSYKLDVAGNVRLGNGTEGIAYLNGGATSYASIQFQYAGTTKGMIRGDGSSGGLIFSGSGTTEQMRIDSSGNTFIGTASTVWDERVGIRPVASTGQVGLGVYSPSTTYQTSLIRVQSENPTGAAWNLFDGRGAGGAIKILIDGNGLVNLYSGQIKFPATQSASSDANTLDDYEEGTWTPVLTSSGGAVTATYNRQQGKYVKIGNMVYISGSINTGTTAATPAGAARIGGLPFTSANSNGEADRVSLIMSYVQFTASATAQPRTLLVHANNTIADFYRADGADARSGYTTQVQQSEINTSGVNIYFSGTYFTPT